MTSQITTEKQQNVFDKVYATSATPFPALLGSVTYLSQALFLAPRPVKQIESTSMLGSKTLTQFVMENPSKKNSLLFGSAMGLASFMIFDQDLESGAGLASVWSTLYLIVNRKYLYNGLRHVRLQPVLASTIAAANAVIYGRRYLLDAL